MSFDTQPLPSAGDVPSDVDARGEDACGVPAIKTAHIGPCSIPKWTKLVQALLWIAAAVASFQGSYHSSRTPSLIVIYLFALMQLSRAETWRGALYSGLAVGLLNAACGLSFFWTIFSAAAITLWLVYAFWIGLFVALARIALRLKSITGWLLIPFLWCGLEYFRSELYYLRFPWLSPGFAFADEPWAMPLKQFGTYGVGLLIAAVGTGAAILWHKSLLRSLAMLAAGVAILRLSAFLLPDTKPSDPPAATIRVAGIQLEFPTEKEVLVRLNELVRKVPRLDLIVLSEYAFSEPVPDRILKWCRDNRVYLIAGAKEAAPASNFYNTACVVSPAGEVIFRQVKSVPIQFFKDGLSAPEQRVWKSPWGKIGICICYDLSYSRVTDGLVELGAQALIVPTMDVADWGKRQHRLHARIAPVRAREYGIPIFRVASSGISQSVDEKGHVRESAPFPGEAAVLADTLVLATSGSRPIDRWVGPFSVGLSAAFLVFSIVRSVWKKRFYAGTSSR